MQRQIPLTTGVSEKDVAGTETLINLYPRQTSGGKYPYKLIGTAGLAFFCELPTKPVKALYKYGPRVFAVTPSKIYEIHSNSSFTELGDVSLFGNRLSVADNGLQMVVVDGIKGYSLDFDSNEVKQIEQEGFYPSSTVTYQDGYFIFSRAGTGQFYLSELLDTDFDPNDFGTAEGQPDKLLAVLSDHREVFMFGESTIEVWYNSGDPDLPFERNQGAFIEKGCAAPYAITKQNNTIYFVGSDLMVYQMSGYTPIRISTHEVERTIKDVSLSDAFSYTYQDQGHLFYMLTIPAANITWCYDISSGTWHIRQSYQFGRHISNCIVNAFSRNLVGDFQSGVIYELSQDYYRDNLDPIVRVMTLPTIANGREFVTVNSLELDMSSGVGVNFGDGFDPELRVFVSKDGGSTYAQNHRNVKIGKQGEFLTRVKTNRLGRARQFNFKIEISDPIPVSIGGAWVDVT